MGVFDYKGNPLTRERIRVCGFNVGNFANGESGVPAGTDELYNKFIDTFRKCHSDIYMFSEWDQNWNNNETSEEVFGFLLPYKSTYTPPYQSAAYVGQKTYSAFEITGEYHEDYTGDTNGRYFIDDIIQINGKSIHLICTHLTLWTKADALAEIQQIINYISDNNITSYIIGGDMNLGLHGNDDIPQTVENRIAIALEEIELLESLGGHSIQGSGWGQKDRSFLFNTVYHEGYARENIGPFDNFVVSPDIKINNMELVITEASDHDALCIDLTV